MSEFLLGMKPEVNMTRERLSQGLRPIVDFVREEFSHSTKFFPLSIREEKEREKKRKERGFVTTVTKLGSRKHEV